MFQQNRKRGALEESQREHGPLLGLFDGQSTGGTGCVTGHQMEVSVSPLAPVTAQLSPRWTLGMALFATISNGYGMCGSIMPLGKAELSSHAIWSVGTRKGFVVTRRFMSSGFKPFVMEAPPPDDLLLFVWRPSRRIGPSPRE